MAPRTSGRLRRSSTVLTVSSSRRTSYERRNQTSLHSWTSIPARSSKRPRRKWESRPSQAAGPEDAVASSEARVGHVSLTFRVIGATVSTYPFGSVFARMSCRSFVRSFSGTPSRNFRFLPVFSHSRNSSCFETYKDLTVFCTNCVAHADLVRVVVPLNELDEEPFVVEEFAGEGLQERAERVLVFVDRRQEFRALGLQIRFELLDVRGPESEVLHVCLGVLLRFSRETVGEGRLGVGHLFGGAQAEDDREPLSCQGTEARKGRHRGLRFADPFGLVDRRVSAVQEEVAERSVGVQVPAEDRLVVHLEFQVSGEGRHGVTG